MIIGTVQFCSFSRVFFVLFQKISIFISRKVIFFNSKGRGVSSLKICKGKDGNYRGYGFKSKKPFLEGMDILWNNTFSLLFFMIMIIVIVVEHYICFFYLSF